MRRYLEGGAVIEREHEAFVVGELGQFDGQRLDAEDRVVRRQRLSTEVDAIAARQHAIEGCLDLQHVATGTEQQDAVPEVNALHRLTGQDVYFHGSPRRSEPADPQR